MDLLLILHCLGKFKRDSQLFALLEVCIWIARATIVVNLIQKRWMSGDTTKFYHIQYQLFSLRLFLCLYRQNRSYEITFFFTALIN